MNSNYIKSLIKAGIKAATAVGALAAAALILKSDNIGKPEQSNSEQPKPKPPAAPEAEKAAPPKTEQTSNETCAFPDELYLKPSDIYVPDTQKAGKGEVPYIELTEKQAIEQGWSFHKKSKAIRITNYHGKERDIVIPSRIGGKRVNELAARAFIHAKIDSVQIPGSIIKAGNGLFIQSTVKNVMFGNGLRVIPKEAFYFCVSLSRVILPETVFEIGERAFFGCRSLEYIKFPDSLFKIEEYAFNDSGLKGFSTRKPIRLNDGSAFLYTPLYEDYELIATRNDKEFLDILLIGKNAKIKLPPKQVLLKCSSICGDCSLDFSECKDLELRGALRERMFFGHNTNIVVRRGQEGYYFGKKASVKYTDGAPYPGLLTPVKQSADHLTVKFSGAAFRWQIIPSEYIEFGVKSLKIVTDVFFTIQHAAFNDPNLERLDIDYYFGADGGIFSRNCNALREFHWKGKYNNGQFVQYIPPIEATSVYVHRELLKAFCDTENWFFDSSVIEKIFRNRYIDLPYLISGRNSKRYEIRQRELIPLAIDILRSTPYQFPNGTKLYSDYLRRHLKYARKVCEKLNPGYPEYSRFLNSFK